MTRPVTTAAVAAIVALTTSSGCARDELPAAERTAIRGTTTATTARWMPVLNARADWRAVTSDDVIVAAQPLLRFRSPDKPTLFAFWATYCPPCFSELPLLKRLHADGRIGVVSVSLDATQTRLAAAALGHHGVEHSSLVLTEASLPAVGDRLPQGLPFSLLLDRDGQVVAHFTGVLEPDALTRRLATGLE